MNKLKEKNKRTCNAYLAGAKCEYKQNKKKNNCSYMGYCDYQLPKTKKGY